jgi:hypothetical protein
VEAGKVKNQAKKSSQKPGKKRNPGKSTNKYVNDTTSVSFHGKDLNIIRSFDLVENGKTSHFTTIVGTFDFKNVPNPIFSIVKKVLLAVGFISKTNNLGEDSAKVITNAISYAESLSVLVKEVPAKSPTPEPVNKADDHITE